VQRNGGDVGDRRPGIHLGRGNDGIDPVDHARRGPLVRQDIERMEVAVTDGSLRRAWWSMVLEACRAGLEPGPSRSLDDRPQLLELALERQGFRIEARHRYGAHQWLDRQLVQAYLQVHPRVDDLLEDGRQGSDQPQPRDEGLAGAKPLDA